MPLVKAITASRLDTFSFHDVERQAVDLMKEAHRQAAEVKAAATAEAETIRRQAAEQGHAEGHAEGVVAGRADGEQAGRQEAFEQQATELREFAGALAGMLNEIGQRHQALHDAAAEHVTALAVAVAEKVTKRQGALDVEVLKANVTAAARCVADAGALRLAIHPDQASALAEALPLLGVEWPALADAAVMPDKSVTPGGCRVHAAGGTVDADLQTQLDRLAAELLPENT
jgi:flagellar assembly protein FliH